MSNEIATPQVQQNTMQSYCFSSASAFEAAQRMATALSKATLVPKEYQNNIPNCIIALEVACRMNASPTMVMQNLYIVHGKPSWSSQFIISAVNSCGRFRPLRFELTGKEGAEDRNCVAWTVERSVEMPVNIQTLDDAKKAKLPILESPRISIDMAKKEGWYGKNGSKWQTMPDLMLRYRSASFFGKLYAPEILMGMQTQEEAEDIAPAVRDVTPHDNAPLANAFMNNTDISNMETTAPTNKLDEILTNPAPKAPNPPKAGVSIDGVIEDDPDPALERALTIIQEVNNAPSEAKLKYILNLNVDHINAMSSEWQQKIDDAAQLCQEKLTVKQ